MPRLDIALLVISSILSCAPLPRTNVLTVIDGDTIIVDTAGQPAVIRYIGMNAPEAHELGGAAATAANHQLVAGKYVRLERDVSNADRYGRLLRYVYVDGKMVNAELVRLGFARATSYPPNTRHDASIRKASP